MTVYLAGDDIRCRGPRGAVPTDLLARLRALKAEIAAELRVADCGTIARPAAPPPDPVDIAEAAAIRAGAAGLTAREADTRVLREHGFNGWPAYAGEWRRHILDELAVLPPTCSIDAVRLKRATQAFVMSTDLDTAMSCGWSVPALVGVRRLSTAGTSPASCAARQWPIRRQRSQLSHPTACASPTNAARRPCAAGLPWPISKPRSPGGAVAGLCNQD